MTTESVCPRQKVALIRCPLASRWNIPLALPSLAAFLEESGYEAKCWDLNLEFQDHLQSRGLPLRLLDEKKWYRLKVDPQNEAILAELVGAWAGLILRDRPTVVGLSMPLVTMKASLMLAQAIKKLDPDIVVVGGGPECMYSWSELISQDAVDYVILGEGERPLVELLRSLDHGRKSPDISSVVTKDRRDGPHAAAVNADLDQLPYPDFSKLDFARYADHGVVDLPIFGSVGCIRNCTFCSRRFLNDAYRYKSPNRIIKELERGVELYGTKSFFFVDSLINGKVEQLREWTTGVAERQMGIRWHSNAILDPKTTRDLLHTMRESGCTRLWYGLESGSAAVLNSMGKYSDIQGIERIIRDTHEAGIIATCFLIVGYPTETESDFQETLDFLRRNRESVDEVYPLLCEVQDETALGREKERYGIMGSGYDWHNSNSDPELRRTRLRQLQCVLKDLGISTHQDTGRDFVGTEP